MQVLALAWLGMVVLAIVGGTCLVWITDGWEAMVDTFRPREWISYFVVVLGLAPPVLLLVWAESWRRRRR